MNDIDRLHMVWDGICSAAGSDAMGTSAAIAAGGAPLRRAPTAPGYPDASRSANALGAALRVLQRRQGAGGAAIRWVHRRNGNAWYVHRPTAEEAVTPSRRRELVALVARLDGKRTADQREWAREEARATLAGGAHGEDRVLAEATLELT